MEETCDYEAGLHTEWEEALSDIVGDGFTTDKLTAPGITHDVVVQAANPHEPEQVAIRWLKAL